MMKRVSLFLLLAMALCLSSAGILSAQDGVVEIEFSFPIAVDAPITETLNQYIADFEAANPDIKVTPVFAGGYTDAMTAIMTTIDGGGEPPAVAVLLATALYDLINADAIAPMTPFINEMGEAFLDGFYPAFLSNSYYGDDVWSMPFQRSAVVLYYNADLLKEEGIDVPNSWESLAAAAEALTVRDGDNVTRWGIEWPSDWPYWLFQPLAIGSGQNIVGDNDAEVFFDNPDVIEAVQYYIDLSAVHGATQPGVQANWGQATTDLASGGAAMIVHSSGSLSGLIAQSDFELGVMAVPGQEADTYATVPGGGNLYIFNNIPEEKQQAAWRFVEFLVQPEIAADWSIKTGYIAASPAAYETDAMVSYLEEVPQAAMTRDAMQYAQAEMSLQNLGQVRSIFHDYLQQAFNGEMSPADAMAAAQADADEALAPFRE